MKFVKLLATAITLMSVASAHAGVISNRAALGMALGSNAVTYDFETAPVVVNNSTSSYAGVVISGDSGLQYNAPGYYGAPSHEIDPYYSTATFDFTSPVTSFGVDLRAYSGYPSTVSAVIYGSDDKTVIANIQSFSLSGDGKPIFFGYSDVAIGKVEFDIGTGYANFDNLTFGAAQSAAVPEPTGIALVLSGLGIMGGLAPRRRNKQA